MIHCLDLNLRSRLDCRVRDSMYFRVWLSKVMVVVGTLNYLFLLVSLVDSGGGGSLSDVWLSGRMCVISGTEKSDYDKELGKGK